LVDPCSPSRYIARGQIRGQQMYKKCSKCKETKLIQEFWRNKSNKDGCDDYCKKCRKTYYTYKKNEVARAKASKRYYEKNKINLCAYSKEYRQKNKAIISAKHKVYYAKNKEKRAEAAKRYYQKNIARERGKKYARYGITKENFNQISRAQGDKCAICGVKPKNRALCIDHDHQTGEMRGLLCSKCNSGLGYFQDNVSFLDKAAIYLRRHKIGIKVG